jgi:chemotaxis signal transduction protein
MNRQKRQFCTFRIAGRLFGIDILNVKEVNQEVGFTPIFHAPKEVKGYVNIRGQIYLILDLRLLLGFEPGDITEKSRVILFKPDVGEPFGVLADQIGDVVEADEGRIETRSAYDKKNAKSGKQKLSDLWAGVCKLEDTLMVILNARNFLKHLES